MPKDPAKFTTVEFTLKFEGTHVLNVVGKATNRQELRGLVRVIRAFESAFPDTQSSFAFDGLLPTK